MILLFLLDFPSCSAVSDLVRQIRVSLWKPRHSAVWWMMILWQ